MVVEEEVEDEEGTSASLARVVLLLKAAALCKSSISCKISHAIRICSEYLSCRAAVSISSAAARADVKWLSFTSEDFSTFAVG